MGKRSDFERVPRDFYPTPPEAVEPLIDHLPLKFRYAEPCAGDGALISALKPHGGTCIYACDIEPRAPGIHRREADDIETQLLIELADPDFIITNPPWARPILHRMIDRFRQIAPTWLLFDADWMHTKQAAPYLPYLQGIVSVGRVKWIPDSKMTGKDNCAWYRFSKNPAPSTKFFGRKG